jgi:ABC-2 type transport system permease protein
MNNLLPLMQREWLQHRFAWALLALVPLALSLVVFGIATIELDDDMNAMAPQDLALLLASLTVVISVGVMLLLFGVTSLFNAIGSPRRDHGDRSIEFWLSLPSGHAESLIAPMLVHLLLVPLAAVAAGLLAAVPMSMVVVGRVVGLEAWFALPWGTIAAAAGSMGLRLAAGLPLAMVWLLPLLLAAMLANAFFRRWGLPLLVVAVALVSIGMDRVFGQPLLVQAIGMLASHAATSLAGASGGGGITVDGAGEARNALAVLPRWALHDFAAAVQDLMQPALVGAFAASAVLFAALLWWRRRLAVAG